MKRRSASNERTTVGKGDGEAEIDGARGGARDEEWQLRAESESIGKSDSDSCSDGATRSGVGGRFEKIDCNRKVSAGIDSEGTTEGERRGMEGNDWANKMTTAGDDVGDDDGQYKGDTDGKIDKGAAEKDQAPLCGWRREKRQRQNRRGKRQRDQRRRRR